MDKLQSLAWPAARLGEAVEELALRSRLPVSQRTAVPFDPSPVGESDADARIEAAAKRLGLEAETIDVGFDQADKLIRCAGPALVGLPGTRGAVLALQAGRGRRAILLAPSGRSRHCSVRDLRSALFRDVEAPVRSAVEQLLNQAGIPQRRRARAARELVANHLARTRIGRCWLLHPSPTALSSRARRARLPLRLATLAGAHGLYYSAWLLSWWTIGAGVLQGRVEPGWLMAWALLLATLIPLRMWATWNQGLFAIDASTLLKERFLFGILAHDPEKIRRWGAGRMLGRVIETEAVGSLALSGGFMALLSILELAAAAVVLGLVGLGPLPVLLLTVWVSAFLLMGWRLLRLRRTWTDKRLKMTHDLVEKMSGHRTRLVQERPDRRHQEEDRELSGYLRLSARMDRWSALLASAAPRGWLIVGLLGLAPAFLAGASSSTLAVGLGGLLLAFQAFEKLSEGLSHLCGAAVSWERASPFFEAAPEPHPTAQPSPKTSDPRPGRLILQAKALSFRYPRSAASVLKSCSLQVREGDRVLLEGPSGGGKSTLASLLTGMRQPCSGLLLLDGLDRRTWGLEGWRNRVATAPQFHENHIFTATLAFNLLMGRRWPPTSQDLKEAESLCRRLGLGPLLGRMPAGMMQMVGETGWRLSHGEKSRIFMARALLRRAELVVLDESFAALDPQSLHESMRCALDLAPALLVIAHR